MINNTSDNKTISLKGKRVLVTGAAGFIGSYLCKRLLEKEEVSEVIGIDQLNDYYDPALKQHRLGWLKEHSNFVFIKGDIADKSVVTEVFEKYRPQIVVNLAAQAGVRYSLECPDAYIASNIIGFFNVLECCRYNPVEHLVYASSSSVYGDIGRDDGVPFSTEEKTDSPVSLYAATKKTNELMAHVYSRLFNIPATGLRFFTVYGPAGRPDMAYFSFADTLRRGGKIKVFNYGRCKRDFTYIDDIIEGVVRVMHRPPSGGVGDIPFAIFNIGNQSPVGLMDFIEVLCTELKRAGVLPEDLKLEDHMELVPMQPGDVETTYADVSALVKLTGFSPKTDISYGLGRFADWYADYYLHRED